MGSYPRTEDNIRESMDRPYEAKLGFKEELRSRI